MRPSSCQTVRKRSQSPASRQTAQFSTRSRIARRSAVSRGRAWPGSYARAMADTILASATSATRRRRSCATSPGRHDEPAGPRDRGRDAAQGVPRGERGPVRARRPRPGPREPDRPHPRHRRRPVARPPRPHRRRARRPRRLDASPVRGPPRRRRLRLGPRRDRHEERDRLARRHPRLPRPLRVPPARRPAARRRGRRGERRRGGRARLARARAARHRAPTTCSTRAPRSA